MEFLIKLELIKGVALGKQVFFFQEVLSFPMFLICRSEKYCNEYFFPNAFNALLQLLDI